jgi:light-harvesting protein B-800-850 alpha chain
MIYGKIWLHVKPSVGIPLFLSAVAISSFAVHVALTLNTTWVKRYHNGSASANPVAAAAAAAAMAPPMAPK